MTHFALLNLSLQRNVNTNSRIGSRTFLNFGKEFCLPNPERSFPQIIIFHLWWYTRLDQIKLLNKWKMDKNSTISSCCPTSGGYKIRSKHGQYARISVEPITWVQKADENESGQMVLESLPEAQRYWVCKLELPHWLQIWPPGLVLVPILAKRWRYLR